MTAQQLIECQLDKKHVVLLGAGASRASCPTGDASGQILPLMDDLIDTLSLQPLLDKARLNTGKEKNFEVIYARLISDPKCEHIAREIERLIRDYFSRLSLPKEATIYDRILISLRPTDAVFTFNWDPFLFDAYRRNHTAVPLPEIFFLHGNVRISACRECGHWGRKGVICPTCSQMFVDVPLLYPIQKKNYSEGADPYIQSAWKNAENLFRDAFTLTIFGYGAPASDEEAVRLLKGAWINEHRSREFEHIEVIDTAPSSHLYDRWSPFTPTHHHHFIETFEQSRISRWPRRSCESIFYPMTKGIPCEDFPLPNTNSLTELQAYAAAIAQREGHGH